MFSRQFKIVGLGEVLWDVLPKGKQLGGAPANFAYVAGQLENCGINRHANQIGAFVASKQGAMPDFRGLQIK